jgi:D-alanine-D-alanine ligase-like ATP-grasp enzyme
MAEGAFHEYREREGKCAACGNSPVNHLESYINNTLTVWSGGFGGRVGAAVNRIEPWFYRLLAHLPCSRFSKDVSKAVTYRSQVVWEEALRRGIEMEQLVFFGMPTEVYRARRSGAWRYFQSLPVSQREAAWDWIDDKYRLKRQLQEAGIATPRAIAVTSLEQALSAMRALDSAVVVKPRIGSRGRHTTVNVRTEAELAEAFRSAKQLCRYVVIEEYLEGSVCRATVVGGALAGFFQAFPPRVVGDGIFSIRDLVAEANARKPERVQDIALRDEHERFLARLGYTPASVLPLGAVVALTHRTGRLFGGRTRELFGAEHPALRAAVERAARTLRAPIVGFDIIMPEPELDPARQRWGIIEANSVPYIDIHYLPLEGQPSIVARQVWDYAEAEAAL